MSYVANRGKTTTTRRRVGERIRMTSSMTYPGLALTDHRREPDVDGVTATAQARPGTVVTPQHADEESGS